MGIKTDWEDWLDGILDEDIPRDKIREIAEELAHMEKANKDLKELVRAIRVPEFQGMYCEDVKNGNWFDAAKKLAGWNNGKV